MRLKIDKVTIYLLSVYVFNMVAIIGASVLMGSSQQGYLAIGCLSCIHVVCALLLLRRAEGTIITISGIFVIFLYVFHMGQFFLNVAREIYKISNVGTVIGAHVQNGKITRSAQIRVVRDGIVIAEDKIASLRRFKDDVKEVADGFDCGIGLERFNDVKVGDVLEAFTMEEYRD